MTTTPDPVNPYAAPEAPAGVNSLARASFIIAIVLVVLAVVLAIFSRFVPTIMYDFALSASGIGIIFGVISFVNLILGVFALVLGLAGARRSDRQLLAGIGVGVGGFVAISNLVSLVATPLFALIY
jgi:hypothetical protein